MLTELPALTDPSGDPSAANPEREAFLPKDQQMGSRVQQSTRRAKGCKDSPGWVPRTCRGNHPATAVLQSPALGLTQVGIY